MSEPVLIVSESAEKARLRALLKKPEKGVDDEDSGFYSSDSVTYRGEAEGGKKTKEKDATCFSSITYSGVSLPDWEVTVVIDEEDRPTLEEAFQFLQMLTEAGLVPEGIKVASVKETLEVFIPRHKGHSHLTYFGMCVGRWLNRHPHFVRHILRLHAAEPAVTIYQSLPILSGKWVSNSNHLPVVAEDGEYGPEDGTKNPFLSLALHAFAHHPDLFLDSKTRERWGKASQLVHQTPARAAKYDEYYRETYGHKVRFEFGAQILMPRISEFFRAVPENEEEARNQYCKLLHELAPPKREGIIAKVLVAAANAVMNPCTEEEE